MNSIGCNGEKPIISVIVPVYNGEKYIEQCIRSIMDQTFNNLEIIVVNDGSTDNTVSIINSLISEDNRIHLFSQDNQGVAYAVITGLEQSNGKYIGWVDADDFIDPTMYEKLYDLAITENADYVYCDYSFFPSKVSTKEKWFKPYKGVCDWDYLERNSQRWKSLTLKQLLLDIDISDSYKKYDEYGWLSVLLNSKKTAVLYEELYYYRVGIQSQSGGSYKGKTLKFINGVKHSKDLNQIIPEDKKNPDLLQYFEYRYIYALLQLLIVSSINRDKEVYANTKNELERLNYNDNVYTKMISDHNHGKLKSFVLRRIIPSSYFVSRHIVDFVYK